jgi:hypothetical protein
VQRGCPGHNPQGLYARVSTTNTVTLPKETEKGAPVVPQTIRPGCALRQNRILVDRVKSFLKSLFARRYADVNS